MDGKFQGMKLIAGNSNRALAQEISGLLDIPLTNATIETFSDGEISVNTYDTVRGADVYVIQSTSFPVNDNLMELLIIIDAMKRASAGRINAVIPYYGYGRQDRKAKSRDPITAKLVADLITVAGADRVITMDLHATQIQGFFNVPVDHLLGMNILANYFRDLKLKDLVVVSPDAGSVKRSRKLAEKLDAPLAIIDKRRPKANVSEVMNIIGDIVNKNCILLDDMIDTAGTICNGSDALMKLGAKSVYTACTHGVLSGPAIDRLSSDNIKQVVTLNTIQMPEEKRLDKMVVLSVGSLFAKAIERVHDSKSLSKLFED
ncbi:ribose-phosphate diphosphokinase [Alkalibaculum sp. M08DMB]|uniref:Ribose-phosphate pyrophosphokinase n=1 Tax=Alkalibaculum sporogenes TaxID=2655001 RepID=A0A6A7K6H9_9FIRM|nr:ribose-phosphate pyrophosphokinase [Alkalibaculum sporogenes]MPW24975.1 ribose-phosphate diphosphokinase [Alkalibaculum sporogenes]